MSVMSTTDVLMLRDVTLFCDGNKTSLAYAMKLTAYDWEALVTAFPGKVKEKSESENETLLELLSGFTRRESWVPL
jgi:hypothetical protein